MHAPRISFFAVLLTESLSGVVIIMSVLGLKNKRTRTYWFGLIIFLALLTFIYALNPFIGIPVLN